MNLQEKIRREISAQLSSRYITEWSPMQVNIVIGEEKSLGLSTNDMPLVEYIFHDYEGIIWIKIYGMEEPIEIDDSMFSINDLKAILKELEYD